MATAAANEILAEWENSLKSYRGHKKTGASGLLPTALQLYKLGLFLDAMAAVSQREHTAVQRGYHEFIKALPVEYRESLLKDLNQAFWSVVGGGVSDGEEETENAENAALQSVSQLLDASVIVAQECSSQWTIDHLSKLLESYNSNSSSDSSNKNACILVLFQSYLLHSQADFEQLLPALHLLQQEENVWNDLVQQLNTKNRHWKEIILQHFSDESQQEYLMSLLATSGHAEEQVLAQQLKHATRITSGGSSGSSSSKQKSTPTSTSKEQEIQRRIDQVKAVLPDLGDGFVETALAAHQGAVEATVATLLEPTDHWPAILRATDQLLPRRKHEFAASSQQEEAQAKEIAKATLQAAERQQEQEAYMVDLVLRTGMDDDEQDNMQVQPRHDEYNDDYDDQYDELDGVGNADAGLYDNYDAVRVYNAALKEVGAEQTFWQENRNTNQSQNIVSSKKKNNFGPDKMKGGRIPGRGHGGRGGRGGGGAATSTSVSAAGNINNQAGEDNSNNRDKPNLRQKARKMDKRRDQQKKAQVKRSGA